MKFNVNALFFGLLIIIICSACSLKNSSSDISESNKSNSSDSDVRNEEYRVELQEENINLRQEMIFRVISNGLIEVRNDLEIKVGGEYMSFISNLDNRYSLDSISLSRWGYGGDYYAKVIKYRGNDFFSILPNGNDNVILGISVSSKDIKTDEGISVGMTVKDLLLKYPDLLFEIDIISGHEICRLPKTMITLVFNTNSESRIGVYEDDLPETSSFPEHNLDSEVSEILIR